jgi:dTMP kinase
MPRGVFVVLEGPEGAGKTTLAQRLAARLEALGLAPVLVREPGGTPAAEALRAELLDAERSWTPEMELLYMVTARADLVTRVIRPALEQGRIVLSDRYDLSTRAYQGAGRGLPADQVEWVNRAATGGLVPDLTLVLDLPDAVRAERVSRNGRHQNRLDRESAAFHARVAEHYRAAQGPGIRHLDATLPPDALLEAAWRELQAAFPDRVPAG